MATESLKLGRAWDDTFEGWTRDLELGRKLKKPKAAPKASSGWTGSTVAARQVLEYAGKGTKSDVRGRLQGIAKRSRQVMVKITPGKNATMRAVRKHLAYIAQEGEGVVIDQNGNEAKDLEAVQDMAWAWQHTGPAMPDNSDVRLAFNIMFSMPEGTDEKAVYAAVKATADVEFAGHQWVMGQHFDQPQVHCHLSVKAEGMDGTRLNPRKADLNRWRERFAHELRERGVEAEATKRATRLHKDLVKKPWKISKLEDQGKVANNHHKPASEERIKKWKDTEQKAASSYEKIIASLSRSDDAADRVLAKELQTTVAKSTKIPERFSDRSQPIEAERN
jgi:Relaxase/Mobilisation nuclease domain